MKNFKTNQMDHRQTRGEHFEGDGGPEDKLAQRERDMGGYNNTNELGARGDGAGGSDTRPLNEATIPRKPQFKGEDYYRPEDVPDSVAAQGEVPPGSVTGASRDAEI
jgi:hypothetical protein